MDVDLEGTFNFGIFRRAQNPKGITGTGGFSTIPLAAVHRPRAGGLLLNKTARSFLNFLTTAGRGEQNGQQPVQTPAHCLGGFFFQFIFGKNIRADV